MPYSPEHTKKSKARIVEAALCVGGMVLARALPDGALAHDVRAAAYDAAVGLG